MVDSASKDGFAFSEMEFEFVHFKVSEATSLQLTSIGNNHMTKDVLDYRVFIDLFNEIFFFFF